MVIHWIMKINGKGFNLMSVFIGVECFSIPIFYAGRRCVFGFHFISTQIIHEKFQQKCKPVICVHGCEWILWKERGGRKRACKHGF